jgi:hypothetical protein
VKRVNKELENQPAEINMMVLFERMLQEQRAQSEAASAVERIVKRNGEFNGKDVSRYLRDYKAQMLRCGISENYQVIAFNRVATDHLQTTLRELQQQHPTWPAFEAAMKTAYAVEDSSKVTWRGFEDWVAVPNKGLNVLEVFSEFESRFEMLSTRDQALLVADKIVLFLRAVDVRDQYELGTLLEDVTTDSGLTDDWETVKRGVTRFTKRRQWLAGEETRNVEPTQRPRPTVESLQPQTRDVPAKTGVDASMLEQLLKGIAGLKIAGMKRNDYGIMKTGVSKIRSTTEEVREATGWECPMDRMSVEALCQFDDVFVDEKRRHTEDEKRRHMEDEFSSSRIPENRNGGKMKVPEVKLSSNIEQWTDQRKVFEEREEITTHALCRQREVSVEEKQKQPDQRLPTCGVATSTIEPPTNLKKLLEERAPHQQEEPPQENQLLIQQPPSPQQQQRKSLKEDDCPISFVFKRNPILVERTKLNSTQQEGTMKELSEENEEPIEEIEEKPVEEGTDLNQEKRTKNEMSNGGATEVVNPKKCTTTALESNGEDDFDSILKPINQRQLMVTTSTTSQVCSCGIEAQYTTFGEDDTALQHAGRWSEGILGRQGIG